VGHAPEKFTIYVVASETILDQYNAAIDNRASHV